MITRLVHDQRGITLPELLVALVISSIVGALAITVFVTANRADVYSQQDTAALDELRFATELITKEVRQARLVYADSTDTYLHVWIDFNIDNQQDLNERVIWEVRTVGGDTDLIRYSEDPNDPITLVAEGMQPVAAFGYDPALPGIPRTITIQLTVDMNTAANTPGERVIQSQIRLRNAATP